MAKATKKQIDDIKKKENEIKAAIKSKEPKAPARLLIKEVEEVVLPTVNEQINGTQTLSRDEQFERLALSRPHNLGSLEQLANEVFVGCEIRIDQFSSRQVAVIVDGRRLPVNGHYTIG